MKKILSGILISLMFGGFIAAQSAGDLDRALEKVDTTIFQKHCWNDKSSSLSIYAVNIEYEGETYKGTQCEGTIKDDGNATYGIVMTENATKKLLQRGDNIHFVVLGDGNKYNVELAVLDPEKNLRYSWIYTVKTKKNEYIEVDFPIKKMRYYLTDKNVKFNKEDINAMYFKLDGKTAVDSGNNSFSFSIFDLEVY